MYNNLHLIVLFIKIPAYFHNIIILLCKFTLSTLFMEITATIQCCRIMKALQLLKVIHKTCLYFHEPTEDFFFKRRNTYQ